MEDSFARYGLPVKIHDDPFKADFVGRINVTKEEVIKERKRRAASGFSLRNVESEHSTCRGGSFLTTVIRICCRIQQSRSIDHFR